MIKKNYLLLWFSFLIGFSAFAQDCPPGGLTFTTQQQVDDFSTNYPNCTEFQGNLLINSSPDPLEQVNNVNGLSQLVSISGNLTFQKFYSESDLEGLNNLNHIGGDLQLLYGEMTSLEGLNNLDTIGGGLIITALNQSGLETLESLSALESLSYVGRIQLNALLLDNLMGLEGLTYIPGSFEILNSTIGNLQGMENVTEIGGSVYFKTVTLNSLQGLNNLTHIGGAFRLNYISNLLNYTGVENLSSVDGNFSITGGYDLLSFEGLENLSTVGNFSIQGCHKILDLTGFDNLSTVNGGFWIRTNDLLVTTDGLDHLETIDGEFNIYWNRKLIDISSLGGIDHTGIDDLWIEKNDSLSMCEIPVICNYLLAHIDSLVHFSFFSQNGLSCGSGTGILSRCEKQGLPGVHYQIFYDLNENKIQDPGEPFYSDVRLMIDPGQIGFHPAFNAVNKIYLEFGNYTLSYDESYNPDWELTTDSSSFFIPLDEFYELNTINFGIKPTVSKTEVLTSMNSLYTRCDQWVSFYIHANNQGTTIADGILWLENDTNIDSTMWIDIPDTIVVGENRYGWYFENLYPGNQVTKEISIKIPGPLDFVIGEQLHFDVYATFTDQTGSHTSTEYDYDPTVFCAYDPNDKLVQPNRQGHYTLFEEDLFYTIRFQNTGNDFAYDVVILDTLQEHLDPSSFRILSSSHPDVLTTTMSEDRYLSFEFRNIFLPDSTSNFDGSQGYVSFMISPKDGLAEETVIENTASIYFDTNPPIVTNTTQNVMVSELPQTIATHELGGETIDLNIFPNPATNEVNIYSNTLKDAMIELLDLNGRVLLKQAFNFHQNIDLQNFPSGFYLIKFSKAGYVFTEKMVKY